MPMSCAPVQCSTEILESENCNAEGKEIQLCQYSMQDRLFDTVGKPMWTVQANTTSGPMLALLHSVFGTVQAYLLAPEPAC